MRSKVNFVIATLTCVIGLACLHAHAQGDQAAPLAEQLKAQYQLVKTTGYQDSFRVAEPGTVLVVQKAGIVGSPAGDLTLLVSKYQDGQLHSPGSFAQGMKKVRRAFEVGDKVYVSKIDVNLGKDAISLWILECGSCNGIGQPDSFRADIAFQFAKGTLQKMSVPDVVDAISQVLAFDQPAESAQHQAQPQQDQPQDQPQQPQSIRVGQSVDEVVAVLGQPDKKVDLGSKQIFVYKDLKVTFKDGKVSDAQ
jgi:hypothetical protein